MAHSEDFRNVQFQDNNMQETLINQLDELGQHFIKHSSKPIYVLAAADDSVDGQFAQLLQQESEDHIGERIILLPYHLGNSHWTGILIEFQAHGQIKRAEYIDSVNECRIVSDRVQKQFIDVYPDDVLQTRDLLKDEGRTSSAKLTIKNLLTAAGVIQFPNSLNSAMDQVQSQTKDDTRSSTHLTEPKQTNILTTVTDITKNDNDYKVPKLQEKLRQGLAKFNLLDTGELLREMQEVQEQIKKLDMHGKKEEAKEEMKFLHGLEELQELSERISQLHFDTPIPNPNHETKLRELQEKLRQGLAKFNLQDVAGLLQEINEKREQIKRFERRGRKENAQNAMELLRELEELLELSEIIPQLKFGPPSPNPNHESKLRELQENLCQGLAKFNLRDAGELLRETQEVQEQIKKLEMQGKKEEAKEEMKFLRGLEELQELSEKISQSNFDPPIPNPNDESKLRELQGNLRQGLAKFNLQDVAGLLQEIKQKREQIERFERRGRKENAQNAMELLRELEELQELSEKISQLNSSTFVSNEEKTPNVDAGWIHPLHIVVDWTDEKLADLEILGADLNMPPCAEKTTMELLEHFKRRLPSDCMSSQDEGIVTRLLHQLQEQVKKQELLSEEIRTNLRDLNRVIHSGDCSSAVRVLEELLKKIRPLNVQEIRRLVDKTEKAGALIRGKEIILLIGATGTDKSTTIQFLAGAKMEMTRVKIAHETFLKHITAVGALKNPGLSRVISSPFNKSETRYIAPVTVQLKDIIGPWETGDITLSDAPGFGDRAGPEVDIANGVGLIEALKECKSVKLLVLSNYVSLGARGEGIQKLAHTLINMVDGIKDRLDTIFYAFIKYPDETDINASLLDIKKWKVDNDPSLRSDTAFVTVLSDMIEKTKDGAHKIDPVHDDPEILIRKLKCIRNIAFPGEVFKFPMREETHAAIANHVNRDKLSIICAVKHKDNDLLVYYLKDLKILSDLIKQPFVRDAHEDSKRRISENISEYCTEVMSKFTRALASQDGLREEDILYYKTSVEYIQQAQTLSEHLGSNLMSHAALIQHIGSELENRKLLLEEEDLHSPLVGIYLDNLRMLKKSFKELEADYRSSSENFAQRYNKLIQSAEELIVTSEFQELAEILFLVSKCLYVLKDHLGEQVEEKYRNIIESLLKHLRSFSEKAGPLLQKIRLSDSDLEILRKGMEKVRVAKETSALQDRISTYMKMLKNKTDASEERNIEYISEEIFQDLDEIYNEFIAKIMSHFEQISLRIKEHFEKNEDQALEHIGKLVADMEAIRTIPELEPKTAGTYYRTIESVRGYMLQLSRDAEKFFATDHQSGTTNCTHLARTLLRLKNAEWIDHVNPGAYEVLMQRMTEESVLHAQQLKDRLMKLNLSLKYPENVCVALEILEKIDSMSALEHCVPELEQWRVSIYQQFLQSTRGAFDHIQKTFNLQDKAVHQMKQELKEIEQIKREYGILHPALVYLRKQEYPDINELNHQIQTLKTTQKRELEAAEVERRDAERHLMSLNEIAKKYRDANYSAKNNENSAQKVARVLGILPEKKNIQLDNAVMKLGYSSIAAVDEAITKAKEMSDAKVRQIRHNHIEITSSLTSRESIRKEYDSLLHRHDSASSLEMSFLQEKGFHSFELLNQNIQEKTEIITECEKNKQPYNFSDQLDASAANNALVYASECEKVDDVRIKEIAADTTRILQKYICEYGNFLNHEIDTKFQHARSVNTEGDLSQYSQDLEMRLRELSSLNKYVRVSECLDATEKIQNWHRKFLGYHRNLSHNMEQYKVSGKNKDLRDQLLIAQALSCVDRFCADVFAENGFGALYRQFQVEANKESTAAYKVVLDSISKEDYAKADVALSVMDDMPLNPRDSAQIKHDLQSSLNKLMKDAKSMAHWLDGKMEREEDTRNQIREMKENIEKIRVALKKKRIMELLEAETQNELKSFMDDIDRVLSEIILKGLNAIEAFMDADSFSEAEQGMANLSRAQNELADYCTSNMVTEKSKELRKRLDGIVTEISKRNNFANINNYPVNPPKDLLEKLKSVATRGNARFLQAHTFIFGEVRQNFSRAIDQARDASLGERSGKIHALNYALCFLPEELQTPFKLQIDELSKLLTDEEKTCKHNLDEVLTSVDEDDCAIMKIGVLAQQYSEQNAHELSKILCSEISRKLYVYRTNVETSLDKHDMQTAVDIVTKFLKFRKSLGSYISEIEIIYVSVRSLISKSCCHCSDTLADIITIEQTHTVEKAFINMIICIDFSGTFNKIGEHFLSDNVLQHCSEGFQKMYEYLHENSKKYQIAISNMNVVELHRVMIISKRWVNLLQKIKECHSKHDLIQKLLHDVTNVIPYTGMISDLGREIKKIITHLNAPLISDETTRFEKVRDEFFRNLMNSINTLNEISLKFKAMLPFELDIHKLEEDLKKKVETISDQLLVNASKTELSLRDSDQFRIFYNHISSFNKHVRLPGFDIRNVLDAAEEKVFENVAFLRREIAASGSDAKKVAELLIKMKFFAENLSMFDIKINAEIDEALKIYKVTEGDSTIDKLTMVLQLSDIGNRLISEHSCLSGEDWRKRREKMQKQDDLEYVLIELEGDDVATEILRTRYQTFRRTYDGLVSRVLVSFDQKSGKGPNLDVLISETKILVGTVAQSSNAALWDHSFKDNIPELLAHIFAVWTLKNTQHYNTMRGIDAARAYLLMPHVGQVIAVFRMLGIGYGSYKTIKGYNVPFTGKISNGLINNLVQIGTGEGKSVVLAVTACLFALTGVDVNCSCYSEVLSTRDMNDFASVFQALGIGERIKYGTFNKLCEQLLNEQCDVREQVRDMIINNRSALAATGTKVQIRRKVLLIDEVDVFLSDRFYGGMYTPAVYLRDPPIKALLDSIWRNKTLKSLNSVKALATYKTCATTYSHWIFLFDEAIKDMLATLQSFQSSTYIVQRDRIVYVEGESIVDNVVRGYDTIWAYYHENEKGNISQSSLEANVGIIVNCGTFSYAEMPHDFVYIGGVTGTLDTLAEPEKEILKRVYAVYKATFIPSVFGSSNRTYNSKNDVRVVKESDYFMEIRGEIDVMCNAGRTILVFFESEEKLMAFYNSPELSAMKENVQIIMEEVAARDRELYVKRAASVGRVTLSTRTFGRGTDFICRNQQLLANGGIHVLQTFFSEELSEEYQIMGRGARQGDHGSYRMVLLDKDLEWVLGSVWNEELPNIVGTSLYQALNKARDARYKSKCSAKELGIEQCKRGHKSSKEFMAALSTGNMKIVKEFLLEQNRGANLVTGASRTVLLMDATGSMSNLLSAAKETVCTMYERASVVLMEKGLPSDAFQMQFAIYRNYNSKENKILQVSPWETKASNLRAFMNTISPEGGWGKEAIEIGLWHAVKESEMQGSISQVILIGDTPANTQQAVSEKRASFGEVYWGKTRFGAPTYYMHELQKLKEKNIPVHSFYLTDYAKDNFQKISSETGGRCEQLNIHSSEGAESLIHFVTEEVLRKTPGSQGDALVKLYRTRYINA